MKAVIYSESAPPDVLQLTGVEKPDARRRCSPTFRMDDKCYWYFKNALIKLDGTA